MRKQLFVALGVLGLMIMGQGHAALTVAPPGWLWELVSTRSYADSDIFGENLGSSQSLAPSASSTTTLLTQTLTVTTFDAAGEEAALEGSSSSGGFDFAVCVTSSVWSVNLSGGGSVVIANFDSGAPDHILLCAIFSEYHFL